MSHPLGGNGIAATQVDGTIIPMRASITLPALVRFPVCIAVLFAALTGAGSAAAAATKPSQDAKQSAPVLMSKTGGAGGGWADLKELQDAVAKGNPKAEAHLGELLLRGDGVPADPAKGVALLEKAARAGSSSAAFRLGMLLANGESGVARDPERALAYFKAGAAGGEAEAFFNIGAAYASARGVKRDYAEALGWLIVARKKGATSSAEDALRAQIKSRPAWIATGERRAQEIEQEFSGKKVADFLPPPAPLDTPVDPLKPVLPGAGASKS